MTKITCEGCGVCCQGFVGRITEWDLIKFREIAQSRACEVFSSNDLKIAREPGFYFYKVPRSGFRIDVRLIGDCPAFDSQTRRCLTYDDRPYVCFRYEVGGEDCLNMRRLRLNQ